MHNIATLAAIPVFIVMITLAMLPVLTGVYVYRDANRRGMNGILWTLIAVLAPSLVGFIIYLLVRENYPNLKCPRCETAVTEQYVVCPQCGAKLQPCCPNCAAPVEPDWKVCPRCAQPLPELQEDVAIPVRPKDKGLWKILVSIIVIPMILLLVFGSLFVGVNFSAASAAGSSSMREITTDEYYADTELSESTKAYVQEWLETIPKEMNHAYALRYTYSFDPESSNKDYYYLIYIPGGGAASRRSFGTSADLFGGSHKLELELHDPSGQDGLYCMMSTSKRTAPQLRVTIDGKRLEDEVTVVEFNPTLYTIAAEQQSEMLAETAGDLYVAEIEP